MCSAYSGAIASYLAYDKKRQAGQGRFVLLKEVGEPLLDQLVPDDLVVHALAEVAEKLPQP